MKCIPQQYCRFHVYGSYIHNIYNETKSLFFGAKVLISRLVELIIYVSAL